KVDLSESRRGIDFQQIWKNRATGKFGQQQVFFIGMDDLIASKKISNCRQDQADLEILQEVLNRKNL
ncbi:MAG: hypothetical protein KAJ10_16435, partial [Thermodesulfovibrionia bacterium]|nr:hypothetical protein [Thermodesulfovibrionia bacterium]